MKVRFTLYEGEEMDRALFQKVKWIRGEYGYYDDYDGSYIGGCDEFEVEVDTLSEIKIISFDGLAYAAEKTESYRDGAEWIPYVTIWNPIN